MNDIAKSIAADTGVPVNTIIYLVERIDDEHLIRRAIGLVRKQYGYGNDSDLLDEIMLSCKWMRHWDQRFGDHTSKYEFPSSLSDKRLEL